MGLKRIFRNFLLIMAGVSAMLVALQIYNPKSIAPSVSREAQQLAENRLVAVTPQNFPKIIQAHSGKPQLFFIYTSWCPFCKQQFGILKELQSHFKKEDFVLHYISADEDEYALAEFLQKNHPDLPFTPYHIPREQKEGVSKEFAKMGFTPRDSVPLMLLLDKQGKPAKQFSGLTQVKYVLENLKKLV